jgi:ribosome maturation factor RimP
MNQKDTAAKVPVDMEKCLRISKKILELLQKKTKNSAEAYLTVRLLGIFLEEKLKFKLASDQEEELRKMWRKDQNMPEKSEGLN